MDFLNTIIFNDFSVLHIALMLCAGLFTGAISGFFGIGGGLIIVPIMIALGNDIKMAVGISIMQMIFSSVFGTYSNYKAGKLNPRDGLWVGLGGLLGAGFSGAIIKNMPHIALECAFIALVCFSMARLFSAKASGGANKIGEGAKTNAFMVLCGFVVGIFAISLGIGGGLLLAPLFAYYLGFSTHRIVPLSLFFIIFSSISGFTSLAIAGFVDYTQGAIVGAASLIGVRLGIFLLEKTGAKAHKSALLLMYSIVLFFMIKRVILEFL